MNLSRSYLQGLAAETGFTIGTLEKVVRLGELAGDINRHPLLSDALALKGGTALNLVFSEPRRLSVDLDFNYVQHLERERMLDERPGVEKAVEDLSRRRGYSVQHSRDEHAGRKLYLSYAATSGGREKIELDLNYLFRMPLAGVEKREMWQPGQLDRPRVRVVSLEEICIGKLLALLDRAAVRDAYDVARLPEIAGSVLSSARFRALFIALSITLDLPLGRYGSGRLDSISTNAIDDQLAQMLVGSEVLKAEDLKERAWAVVAPLLTLEPHEGEFLESIQRGELQLELLFPKDEPLARRLAQHPAVQWKLMNVRKYLGENAPK